MSQPYRQNIEFDTDATSFSGTSPDGPRGQNLLEASLIVLMLAAMALLLYLGSVPIK